MFSLKRNISFALMFSFVFICILFPGDVYHIKLVAFGLILICNIDILIKNITNTKYRLLYLFGIGYTGVSFILSCMQLKAPMASAQQIYPGTLILLVILVIELDIPYKKWIKGFFIFMCAFELFVVFLDIIGSIDLYVYYTYPIFNWLQNMESVYIGLTQKGFIYYCIFFKASPLIIILLAEALEVKQYAYAILACVGLYLSGTRANLLAAVIVVLISVFYSVYLKYKHVSATKFVVIVIILMMIIIPISIFVISKIQAGVTSVYSDSIKIKQTIGIINELKNPKNFLLGEGFGSWFKDMGRDGLLQNTAEMSYLDYLRKSGVILFIPFVYFILKPFFTNISIYKKAALFSYLLVAGTNPFLYTSTAFIMYIYIYVEMNKK